MRVLIRSLLVMLVASLTIAAQDDLPPEPPQVPTEYAYTYHRADGNRFADGAGTFPEVTAINLSLNEAALWLDGFANINYFGWRYVTPTLPFPAGIGFYTSGLTQARGGFGGMRVDSIDPAYDGSLALMTPPFSDAVFRTDLPFTESSPLSPAVLLDDDGTYAYIDLDGDVVLWRDGAALGRYAANAMLDARLTVSVSGQIAVYADPTTRYPHDIMGNDVEAGALLILAVENDSLVEIERVTLLPDAVYEAITPMWADVDQDGDADIVTTVSDRAGGARLVVYNVDGSILAETQAIGTGFRWRHIIAAGYFGPLGEFELVEVVTPHIGGIVQFLRYDDATGRLEVAASLRGYTSHLIGSPNLDQAITGDFDGDGTPELVVTTQGRNRLVGLQRGAGRIDEVWAIALDAVPTSNFAAVTLPDGQLTLGIALADASLRVWLPVQGGE